MSYNFYNAFIALRLHFNSDSYDIVKYRGKIGNKVIKSENITRPLSALTKRYRKDDLVEYVVANLANGDSWGGLFAPDGEDVYISWKERTQNLTYNFKRDINNIKSHLKHNSFDSLFKSESSKHPLIMRLYSGKHIMLETVVIINILYDFIGKLDALNGDFMWDHFRRLVCKYQPFLCIDKEKYENIISNAFNE